MIPWPLPWGTTHRPKYHPIDLKLKNLCEFLHGGKTVRVWRPRQGRDTYTVVCFDCDLEAVDAKRIAPIQVNTGITHFQHNELLELRCFLENLPTE